MHAPGARWSLPATPPRKVPTRLMPASLLRRLTLIAGLALALASAGDTRPRPTVPILPVSQVRAGMKGYGLTVFSGTRIESFPITVLGVVKNYIGESDLILIRVDGGYPAKHEVGIVAGMSGSPVYIGGRLVGAVSYGWAFSKEPIGGVTPIESMLRELPPSPGETLRGVQPPPVSEARPLPVPIRTAAGLLTRVQVARHREAGSARQPGTLVLTPVPSLFQVSGFSERAFGALATTLRHLDIEPVRTVASAPPVRTPLPAVAPGSAVGVELLTGDLEIAGTGTLTYVDGRRFLAFGHPLAQLGDVNLPLTAAYVQGVLPSYQAPFKFASQIGPIGTLTTDRLWAVGGTFGPSAPMIPVTLRVSEPSRGHGRTYRLRAIQHRYLTSAVVAQAMMAGVNSTVPAGADVTAQVHYRIQPHGREPIAFDQLVTGAGVDAAISLQLAEVLAQLTSNEFSPLALDGVEVDARLVPGRRTAAIERVYTTRSTYRRGESIDLHVVLRPYGGKAFEQVVAVPVPSDMEKGQIALGVSGGYDGAGLRKRLGLGRPEATSLDQLLRNLATQERGQQLVIRAVYPGKAAVVGGERFPFLPDALRDALPTLPRSDVGIDKDVFEARIDTSWVVRGTEVINADIGTGPETEKKKPEQTARLDAPPSLPVPVAALAPVTATPSLVAATAAPARSGSPPARADVVGNSEKVLPGGTRRWDLQDPAAFSQGRFEGTGLTSDGAVSLSSVATQVPTGGLLPWSLAPAEAGGFVAGTASGSVIHLSAEGAVRLGASWRVNDAAVTAVACTADGAVWAGTSPRGSVWRRAPDGETRQVASTACTYVWALLPRRDDHVLAATGAPARLVRVSGDGRAQTLVTFAERHARAVVASQGGDLLVATAGPGAVYRVRGSARELLFATAYGSVDGLLERVSGEVAAVSGKLLYRWRPDARLCVVPVGDKPLLALAECNGRLVAASASGRLFAIDDNDQVTRIADAGGAVMALQPDGDGVLAAAAGASAFLRASGTPTGSGAWTSDVLDAGSTARWGRLRFMREGEGSVVLQSRSGTTPTPDDSWSPWSPDCSTADGSPVSSPPGRYLQVRARLVGGAGLPVRLTSVSVFYRNEEPRPTLEMARPRGGERLSGTQKVQWKVLAGNVDEMCYDLAYSTDDEHWTAIRRGLGPTLRETALNTAPEVAMMDDLSWDTKTVADGRYRLRVQVRDAARPDASPTATTTSKPFIVTNTPPGLDGLTITRSDDGRVRIRGVARGRLACIVSVTFRQNAERRDEGRDARGGEWRIAQPDDGLYDSEREPFSLVLDEGGAVDIRVTDEAGNSRTIRRTYPGR